MFRMIKRAPAPKLFSSRIANWSEILTVTITYLDKAPLVEYKYIINKMNTFIY